MDEINLISLGLQGKRIEELRSLAERFLDISATEINSFEKSSLIKILSESSLSNDDLEEELKKTEIAFKPSFYVMFISNEQSNPSITDALQGLNKEFEKYKFDSSSKFTSPTYKNFRVSNIKYHKSGPIEIHFVWERIHWYWNPINISKQNIYEFQFGLAILDYASNKGIIACHNIKERKIIVDAIQKTFGIDLTPLLLTKPILDQIGSFDTLRRAGYLLIEENSSLPTNITYADENLALKSTARSEEENPRSQRKHSYYLIPIGSIKEQGIGATSDSGKLWVQREIPITSIREYALNLLRKIGSTLDFLTENEDYEKVITSMNIVQLPSILSIRNQNIRSEICKLTMLLANMLLKKQDLRIFTVNSSVAIEGVPTYFDYPRLELVDDESGESTFFRDVTYNSQLVRIHQDDGKVYLKSNPGNEEITSNVFKHPISGSLITVNNIFEKLCLLPTPLTNEIILNALKHLSNQIPELSKVVCLPFRIFSNKLFLDYRRALNLTGSNFSSALVIPTEVSEINKYLKPNLSTDTDQELLFKLGEKCISESDENCSNCLETKQYLCLRALVGFFLHSPLILKHKCIELSDIQGRIHIGSVEQQAFGFVKLGPNRKSGLTARNNNGAILLSQLIGQLDNPNFNIAIIISPSTINEDLRDRIQTVCNIFNKKVLFMDQRVLLSLLREYQQQAKFESRDLDILYNNSFK